MPNSDATPWTPPNAEYPPPKPGEPALFRAARTGDHSAIRSLAARGEDLNAEFSIGLDPGATDRPATPLMVAAGSGDGATAETVKLLLQLGADPRKRTSAGSAAGFACRGLGWNYRPGGDAVRLRVLLDAGCTLDLSGARGASLAADTASTGDTDRLKLLLELGAPPNPVFGDEERARARESISHLPIDPFADLPPELDGTADILHESLMKVQQEMSDRMSSGPWPHQIPLFAAASSGSAECVRLLLSAGADPGQLDYSGRTALFEASTAEVVEALTRAGTPVDAIDEFQGDAFRRRIEEFNPDDAGGTATRAVLDALIHAGCRLVHPERDRLYDAAFAENPHAVRLLLDLGHPVTPGSDGSTALHAICWHWDYGDERDIATRNIVRMLLDAGVSPNARDAAGRTPIHEAMGGDGVNIVAADELLKSGADIDAVDEEGNTPLMYHYEVLFDYLKVTEFLVARGANPTIRNKRGKTILDLARERLAGEQPDWRVDQWADEGEEPCGWKAPAEEGDPEYLAVRLLEEASRRWSAGQ